MDRAALADFLRRRREALRPGGRRPAPGARRRTPGLRREEVASLAAMSTDYYTRLEQRARSAAERADAGRAGPRAAADRRTSATTCSGWPAATPRPRPPTAAHVAPALLRVLDRLDDTPALILSNLGESLVQNRMAVALLGERPATPGLARSEIYRWFTDPDAAPDLPRGRPRPAEPGPGGQPARRVRPMGPTSRAGELVRALSKRERGVRRAVGTARGRQAVRGPQDAGAPRARPDRAGLPGAVHRGPVAGAAGAHRAAAHRGVEKLQLLGVLGNERFEDAASS